MEFDKARGAINIIKNRVNAALLANRAFEAGKSDPIAKIGMALAKRKENGVLGDGGSDD